MQSRIISPRVGYPEAEINLVELVATVVKRVLLIHCAELASIFAESRWSATS